LRNSIIASAHISSHRRARALVRRTPRETRRLAQRQQQRIARRHAPLQIVLGIVTLLNQAPVALAALHQATAVALFAAAVWHAYEAARERAQAAASA
jgi:heme A synthase